MRILLVKTSSLGDVIHNLPAVSDLKRHFPEARIDWCVEENFAAIPSLHPGVSRIIPVAIRRWRKALFKAATWREIGAAQAALRATAYDLVIDSQGLLKSALLASRVQGIVCGYAADSAREPLAARFYQRRFSISRSQHAVDRNRQLVAAAVGYSADGLPDYGIAPPPGRPDWLAVSPYIVLLTASSRDDKLWPDEHWLALGRQLHARSLRAVLPGGSPAERARAARLAGALPDAIAAPPLSLPALATLLGGANAVVGVDTGLTHLAVALDTPTIALYTATDPGLTGVFGRGYHRNLGGKGLLPSVTEVLDALPAA